MKSIRLLYIDDDAEDALIFKTFIEQNFKSVQVSHRRAQDHADLANFDAMLVDYQMPPTDGVAVSHLASTSHPMMPIVLLTGHDLYELDRVTIYESVDWIANKNDDEQCRCVITALLRYIGRLRHAAQGLC